MENAHRSPLDQSPAKNQVRHRRLKFIIPFVVLVSFIDIGIFYVWFNAELPHVTVMQVREFGEPSPINDCAEPGSCDRTFEVTQYLTPKKARYDYPEGMSIINEYENDKSYVVQWSKKTVRELHPNGEVREFGDARYQGDAACLGEDMGGDLCEMHEFEGREALVRIYSSQANGPFERLAYRLQVKEKSEFSKALEVDRPGHLIRRVDVYTPDGKTLRQSTREFSRKLYPQGVLKASLLGSDPPEFEWPGSFALQKTVKSLQELPPEVREAMLKKNNVQILEAKPSNSATTIASPEASQTMLAAPSASQTVESKPKVESDAKTAPKQ